MTATVQGFRTLFPEFAANTDAQVQMQMDLALAEVNPELWDEALYDYAVYYLTAHYLCLYDWRVGIVVPGLPKPAEYATGVGAKIMKKVGDVQVQYSAEMLAKALDNPYLWTPYGLWYWDHIGPYLGAIAV